MECTHQLSLPYRPILMILYVNVLPLGVAVMWLAFALEV